MCHCWEARLMSFLRVGRVFFLWPAGKLEEHLLQNSLSHFSIAPFMPNSPRETDTPKLHTIHKDPFILQ